MSKANAAWVVGLFIGALIGAVGLFLVHKYGTGWVNLVLFLVMLVVTYVGLQLTSD